LKYPVEKKLRIFDFPKRSINELDPSAIFNEGNSRSCLY
jgi:hypothetical protein